MKNDFYFIQVTHYDSKVENFRVYSSVDVFLDTYIRLKSTSKEIRPISETAYNIAYKTAIPGSVKSLDIKLRSDDSIVGQIEHYEVNRLITGP